jgi:hypothetical protein
MAFTYDFASQRDLLGYEDTRHATAAELALNAVLAGQGRVDLDRHSQDQFSEKRSSIFSKRGCPRRGW